jgi:hypothetical protein
MTSQLDEYRAELIDKILFSASQEQVKGIINKAMKSMDESKVNKHLIVGFISKVINDLASFDPMSKEAQQWANIKSGRILLNRIWIGLNTPTE